MLAPPRSSVAPASGLALPARADGAVRLVEHLATVGYLRALEDRFFFFCAVELARIGDITLEQLLTDHAHDIAQMRWVCYYVLRWNAGLTWAEIARYFNKSKDSVRGGARYFDRMLQSPTRFVTLTTLHRRLTESFLPYQKSQPHVRS